MIDPAEARLAMALEREDVSCSCRRKMGRDCRCDVLPVEDMATILARMTREANMNYRLKGWGDLLRPARGRGSRDSLLQFNV